MKMMKTLLASSLAIAIAQPVMAYEAGDIITRVGAATVVPSDDPGDAAGSKLNVTENTQLGFTATYMLTPDFGVELLAATPFNHTVETKDGDDIATARHLPPTISAQFYTKKPFEDLQPYVGAGLNYTEFFEEKNKAGFGVDSLKSSLGLSVSAGLDYAIDEHLLLNAAVWYIDIDTEVEGGAADGTELEIDPVVWMVGAGFRF